MSKEIRRVGEVQPDVTRSLEALHGFHISFCWLDGLEVCQHFGACYLFSLSPLPMYFNNDDDAISGRGRDVSNRPFRDVLLLS